MPGQVDQHNPAAAERAAEALRRRAAEDPSIVAFWLGGSRGKGRPTRHSDYDCTLILADDAPAALFHELASLKAAGVDLGLMTISAFDRYAGWGSPQAWDRYSFVGLKALIDKTGRVQPMIDAKGCVPAEMAAGFVDTSLDHTLNQLWRGLKCLRDGDPVASRLEAAEAVKPFLEAVFALHGGRLRPYYKYLAWELETWPLERLPFDGRTLPARLEAVLGDEAAQGLQSLVRETQRMFRAAGHGPVFDAWDGALDWMLTWRPGD